MLLQSTVAVDVLRPVMGGCDALGNPVVDSYESETVSGVLIAPDTTDGLGAERPEGYTDGLTLHFPKAYTASLLGCLVELPEPWPPVVRVIGDPQPYMDELTPGQWNRAARVVRADG